MITHLSNSNSWVSAEISRTEYCSVKLEEEQYKAFVYAVKNIYWYQMYIDDLPIWGNVFKSYFNIFKIIIVFKIIFGREYLI